MPARLRAPRQSSAARTSPSRRSTRRPARTIPQTQIPNALMQGEGESIAGPCGLLVESNQARAAPGVRRPAPTRAPARRRAAPSHTPNAHPGAPQPRWLRAGPRGAALRGRRSAPPDAPPAPWCVAGARGARRATYRAPRCTTAQTPLARLRACRRRSWRRGARRRWRERWRPARGRRRRVPRRAWRAGGGGGSTRGAPSATARRAYRIEKSAKSHG